MFPCSKGHLIKAYLDTIQMTLGLKKPQPNEGQIEIEPVGFFSYVRIITITRSLLHFKIEIALVQTPNSKWELQISLGLLALASNDMAN